MSSETPTPEEEQARLAEELADQLMKLKVEDVLVNTLMTVSALGYRRLGAGAEAERERDLAQARLAIEAMRALTPLLQDVVPPELVRDLNQAVANLQLAYAQAAARETRPTTEDGDDAPAG